MVRVAVIGCGYWGPNLVRNLHLLDDCELTLCCDKDPARLGHIQRLYPSLRTTTSFPEVLESQEVDGVVVATPARTHHALVRQALLAGKHVLVEKPLAMTGEECEELIALAGQNRRVLMVGHTFLYSPALLKVKELARPDYLGDLFYLYSHRLNLGRVQSDINALWSIAPHDVSIALYLVGQPPLAVSAQGACYLGSGVEDVVFLTLSFPRGVIAHIHASWIDPSRARRVTVVGSRRMIVYDDVADEGTVRVYDKGVRKATNGATPPQGEPGYQLYSGDIFLPHVARSEPLANECRHFIECIREGKRPLTDGENGLQVVRVLEAAQRSLESQGTPVPVSAERLPREAAQV